LGWQFISVALFFPHFLPYTNEFIINKKYAYKKLADSNICYGEGKKYLNQFLETNKTAVYLPGRPQAGKVVMEINEMLDMNIATINKYNWAKNLKPSGHIHSQYLIFDISKAMADSLQKLYPRMIKKIKTFLEKWGIHSFLLPIFFCTAPLQPILWVGKCGRSHKNAFTDLYFLFTFFLFSIFLYQGP
jgi:hypothetical protein